MIFGRRRKAAEQDRPEADADPGTGAAEGTGDGSTDDAGTDDTGTDDGSGDATAGEADEQVDGDTDDDRDWAALDTSRDWREDGPFDITEVDLEADDVDRIDLGSLVITPHPGMELRLQVAKDSGKVVAAMAMVEQSALELAVYAAPRSGGLWAEIREEIVEATRRQEGRATLTEGPWGTELRRLVPVRTQDGQQGYQPSRTWAAEGPRWLLRGVVYGQAALLEDLSGPAELLHEVFAGCVVRRGDQAVAAGDVVAMTMPEGMTPTRPSDPDRPESTPPAPGGTAITG